MPFAPSQAPSPTPLRKSPAVSSQPPWPGVDAVAVSVASEAPLLGLPQVSVPPSPPTPASAMAWSQLAWASGEVASLEEPGSLPRVAALLPASSEVLSSVSMRYAPVVRGPN